jgi:hypothetical protein
MPHPSKSVVEIVKTTEVELNRSANFASTLEPCQHGHGPFEGSVLLSQLKTLKLFRFRVTAF